MVSSAIGVQTIARSRILLYDVAPCCAAPHRVTSHLAPSYNVAPCCTKSHRAAQRRTVPHNIALTAQIRARSSALSPCIVPCRTTSSHVAQTAPRRAMSRCSTRRCVTSQTRTIQHHATPCRSRAIQRRTVSHNVAPCRTISHLPHKFALVVVHRRPVSYRAAVARDRTVSRDVALLRTPLRCSARRYVTLHYNVALPMPSSCAIEESRQSIDT